jgi:para-nitrobenzyl esterase
MMRTAWLVAACAALLCQTSTWAHGRPGDVERNTHFGKVIGSDDTDTTGTYAWKGIPFAKPPVGSLRWKAPVDPDRWNRPRATQDFANACAQYGRIYGPGANNRYDATIGTTLNQAVGSEDCLYLNIWRPAKDDRKGRGRDDDRGRGHGHDKDDDNLPVIVFVHGGSDVSGYTADPVYDGAALAKAANAVVVTVNYRLGIFGFLDLPQLKSGTNGVGDSGNFALLDIVKALEFVRRDIDAFGGDPRNVTLMGQSAGAINVYALQTSPVITDARQPLFHRAVPLSGGISLATNLAPGRIPTLSPESTYIAQGSALLNNQLIADGLATDAASAAAYVASQTPQQVAAYLRSKTPAALFTTLLTKLSLLGLAGSGPIPDGIVVPVDPIAAIQAGNYLRVPVLAGNTRDEAKLFPTFLALSPALGGVSGRLVSDATLFSTQFSYQPDGPPTVSVEQWIPAQYLPVATPVTGFNARTDLLNQLFFIASRDNVLNALKAQQGDVWYYRFDWDEEPAPWNDIYGAAHAFDLPFIFGTFGPSLFANVANSTANKPGRLDLSHAMMKSLGAFAKRGDPNAPAALGVTWQPWPSTLIFDASPAHKAISIQ